MTSVEWLALIGVGIQAAGWIVVGLAYWTHPAYRRGHINRNERKDIVNDSSSKTAVDQVAGAGRMKMYILIKDSIPPGFAILGAAHASLAAYLKFKDEPAVSEWLSGPFYKVVCRVTEQQFEAAKSVEGHVVLTESALSGAEVAIAFCPRRGWAPMFKAFNLFK